MSHQHLSFWVLLLCLWLTGCGGIKYGEVTGKVVYKGKPLPGGTIHFWPEGAGAPAGATLEEDGSYKAVVPVGEVAVSIETESLATKPSPIPGMWGKGRRPTGIPPEALEQIKAQMQEQIKAQEGQRSKYVKIDGKYGKPKTSGIKTDIHTGTQEVNIELQ
jgi:hypothetical protein